MSSNGKNLRLLFESFPQAFKLKVTKKAQLDSFRRREEGLHIQERYA